MVKEFVVNKVDTYAIQFSSQSNGTFKMYVLRRPPDPHRGGVTQNHVFADGSICVSAGNEPRRMDRAIAIAHFWMTNYSNYIRDAKGRFANHGGRVNV